MEHLPDEHKPPRELVEKAKELDRHYIPTKYPNLHPEGAPMDYYTRADAERAVWDTWWGEDAEVLQE